MITRTSMLCGCGGYTEVLGADTRFDREHTRRHRKCHSCGKDFWTWETTIDLDQLLSQINKIHQMVT